MDGWSPMTDPRKLAVELVVAEEDLDTAEQRIKSKFDDHETRDRRNELLGHARKFADRREEQTA